MVLGDGVQVGQEAVFGCGGDDDDLRVGVADIVVVLEEVGRDDHDLVARVAEDAEYDVQAAGGADGHDDVAGVIVGAEAAVERLGHCLAHGGEAGVGGVAVDAHGVIIGDYVNYGVLHCLGGREVGVADGKVKNVLRTIERGEPLALFEHRADGAAALRQLYHSLTYHCSSSHILKIQRSSQ